MNCAVRSRLRSSICRLLLRRRATASAGAAGAGSGTPACMAMANRAAGSRKTCARSARPERTLLPFALVRVSMGKRLHEEAGEIVARAAGRTRERRELFSPAGGAFSDSGWPREGVADACRSCGAPDRVPAGRARPGASAFPCGWGRIVTKDLALRSRGARPGSAWIGSGAVPQMRPVCAQTWAQRLEDGALQGDSRRTEARE